MTRYWDKMVKLFESFARDITRFRKWLEADEQETDADNARRKSVTMAQNTDADEEDEDVAAEEAGDDDEAGDTVARARTSSPRRDAPPAPRVRAVRSRRPQQPSPGRADGIATPPAPLVRSDA